MFAVVSPSSARTWAATSDGRQPEHPLLARLARPVARLVARFARGAPGPGVGQRADGERLPGARGGDQHLDLRAGGEHPAQRGGLVVAELAPGRGELRHQRVGLLGGQGRGAALDGGVAQGLVGGELPDRRVPRRPGPLEHRRPVRQPQILRPRARVGRLDVPQAGLQGLVGQAVEQLPHPRRVEAEVAGQLVGHGADQVGAGERPALLGDPGQGAVEDVAHRELGGRVRLLGAPEHVGRDRGEAGADLGAQLGVPPVQALLGRLPLVRLRPRGWRGWPPGRGGCAAARSARARSGRCRRRRAAGSWR